LNSYGRVLVPPPDGFQSSSWFAEFDSSLRIKRLDRIDDSAVGIDRQAWNRLEDCRLFRWKDAWWFTATWVLQEQPHVCQVALCRLEGSKVVEWHLLPSPEGSQMEKNWMPQVDGDTLRWIHWIDPMQVLTFGGGGLSCKRLGRYGRLEKWAGSSQLVRYRDGWLCVIHFRYNWRGEIFYAHRCVELTDDLQLRRMSPSFVFETEGVEFCAGLYLTDTHMVLSYGVWDREARLIRLELSVLDAMLRPLYVPRWVSVLIADVRRVMRPWLRQPRKKSSEVFRRLGGFGVLAPSLGDLVASVAQCANFAM